MSRATNSDRRALRECLSVLIRTIPEACSQHRLPSCWGYECDAAIASAARALYGTDRRRWPKGAREAASGKYP